MVIAAPLEIHQSLKVGNKYSVSLTLYHELTLPVNGELTTIPSRLLFEYTLSIYPHQPISANDGDKRAVLHFDRIAMASEVGPVNVTVDTDNPESLKNTEYEALTLLTKHDLTMILDSNDRYVRLQGMQAFASEVEKKPMYSKVLNQILSDKILHLYISQMQMAGTPTKSIGPGDTWPVELSFPMGQFGELKYQGVNMFQGYKTYKDQYNCAKISAEGEINIHSESPNKGPPFDIKDSYFTGTVYFDYALGMPRYSKMIVQVSVGLGTGPKGEPLSANLTQEMEMTILDVTKL